MTVIIGLSGKKRSGKNSVYYLSKILLDEDDMGVVKKVAFADALKHEARMRGWNGVKDEKGRKLLQDLGMERRAQDPDYWVKQAERLVRELVDDADVTKHQSPNQMGEDPSDMECRCGRFESEHKVPKVVFVTDVRFPNEVEMLRRLDERGDSKRYNPEFGSLRSFVWRIRRPVIEHTQTDPHPSETALDDYKGWDSILVANNMEECFNNVKRELTRLGLYNGP